MRVVWIPLVVLFLVAGCVTKAVQGPVEPCSCDVAFDPSQCSGC